jgi:hypothetical protein
VDWGRTLQGKKIRGRRNSLEHLRRRLDGEADADADAPHPSTAHPGVTSHGQGQADALVGFPVPLPLLAPVRRTRHPSGHPRVQYRQHGGERLYVDFLLQSSMIVFLINKSASIVATERKKAVSR